MCVCSTFRPSDFLLFVREGESKGREVGSDDDRQAESVSVGREG